ncbi:hypothetical protein BU26DRAFT_433955, partial [Trematosphaeria pertusa]
KLSIIIYVGEPLDYQKYRHTALCLRPSDGAASIIIHIIGPNMAYQLKTRDNYNSTTSRKFAKEVLVRTLTTPITKAQLVALIYQTPVNNLSREFNCQTWVGDVLQNLAKAGYVTRGACDSSINAMVDAIIEAKEEPE